MKKCPTCGKEFEDSMKFCQVDGTALSDTEPAFDPYATVVGHKLDRTPDESAETKGETGVVRPAVEDAQIHETTGSVPIAPPDDILELPGDDPLKTMYVSDAELEEALGNRGTSSPKADNPVFRADHADAPPPSPFFAPESPIQPLGETETVLSDPTISPFQYQNREPAPAGEWTPSPGATSQSKGLATAALVCGVLSCLCCMPILTGPAGMVMGFIAKKKADENPAEYGGRGFALGGMITGAIGILLGIVQIIWVLFFGGINALMAR